MTSTPDRPFFAALTSLAVVAGLSACAQETEETAPFEQALEALAREDGFTAETRLRESLDQGASRDSLAAYLGKAELLQGNLAEAREWLQPGEFDDDSRGLGFHTLGRLEMVSGNLPAAGAAFDQAFQSIPDDPGLWVDIGRLRYRGGEQVLAVEASLKALELGPDHPRALQFRGQLLRDAEGMQAALPLFERALAGNPDDIDLLADYAATLGELGRAKEMLETVRKMAKLDPGNRRAYFLQAVLAARGGKYDLARALLSRSGDLESDVPAAMLLSAIIDLQNGNHATAALAFDRLLTLQPDNSRLRLLLANALMRGGNYQELVYRFAEDALQQGAHPYLAASVGRAHEALGDRKSAAAYLDRAAQPRPDELITLPAAAALGVVQARTELSGPQTISLMRGLVASGGRDNAARQAARFLRQFPGSADALGLAADTRLAAGQEGAALDLYRQSAAVRRPWAVTKRMIYAHRAAGQNDEARALLQSHVRGDQFNAEAAAMLARYAFESGEWDRASKLADHALALSGGHDPQILLLRAQIAVRRKDEQAEAIAREALAAQPLSEAALDVLRLAQAG